MNQTDLLFSFALNKLTADRERLNSLLEKQKGTDVGRFMERALEWQTDASKRGLLWELFHEVIDMSDLGFIGAFVSFVSNALLDDDLTDKDDPKAEPVVVLDCNDGTQNVTLLMEAMDHKEREVLQRQELENKKNELLAKLRNSVVPRCCGRVES